MTEISRQRTAANLNETLAKTFGQRIDLESFTLDQLQNARNKVRTDLRAIETTESFDATLKNEDYQKHKMYLDVLNAAISEMDNIQEGGINEKGIRAGYSDNARAAQDAIVGGWNAAKKIAGDTWDQIGRGADKTKKRVRTAMNTANANAPKKKSVRTSTTGQQAGGMANRIKRGLDTNSIVYTRGSKLQEGAQEQAELVMAAKELVDTVGKWLQDTAEMQSESMLKLSDAIRDELGQEQADQFQQSVKPTLEALYQALEASRGALTQGVSLLTGEGAPAPAMGAEPAPEGEMEPVEGGAEMGAAPEAGMEAPPDPAMEAGAGGDEFATAPAAGGGAAEAGRPARESINRLSHSLGTILSSKKK